MYIGIEGFEEWVKQNNEQEPFLYVKIYNGHSTSGKHASSFKARDVADLVERVNNEFSGASGRFRISLNKSFSGGTPVNRYIDFSPKAASIGGTPKRDSFAEVGGIMGVIGMNNQIQQLKFDKQLLEMKNEQLQAQIDSPPDDEPFLKEMLRTAINDPKGSKKMMSGIGEMLAPLILAYKNPQAMAGLNGVEGGTKVSTEDVVDEEYQWTPEELNNLLATMIRIRTANFPNKTFTEIVNALEEKLKATPLIAQMLFT